MRQPASFGAYHPVGTARPLRRMAAWAAHFAELLQFWIDFLGLEASPLLINRPGHTHALRSLERKAVEVALSRVAITDLEMYIIRLMSRRKTARRA